MNKSSKSEFSTRLIQTRKQQNLTQQEVASQLYITQPTYSAFERGKYPSIDTLFKIAELLHVTPEYLLTGATLTDLNKSIMEETLASLETIINQETNTLSLRVKAELVCLKYTELVLKHK